MYCTIEDVRNALTPGGSQVDKTTASGLEDTQIIDSIREADSIVNSYINARYTVPQDPLDADRAVEPARFWSRNIAAFLATLTYKRSKDVPADEPVRLRYNLTMAGLLAIREGKATTSLPPIGVTTGSDGVTVINQYQGSMFAPADFALRSDYTGVVVQPYVWPGA